VAFRPLQKPTRLVDLEISYSDMDEVYSDQALARQASLAAVLFFSSCKSERNNEKFTDLQESGMKRCFHVCHCGNDRICSVCVVELRHQVHD
jgi:hypothetical protein